MLPLSHTEDIKRRKLHADGMLDVEIAKECDRSKGAIRLWRQKAGLEGNMSKRIALSDALKKKFYGQGLLDAEIAQACHCNTSDVAYWRKKNGLDKNTIEKECECCQQPYFATTKQRKNCEKCQDTFRKINSDIYLTVRQMRRDYAHECRTNPEWAKKFKENMIVTEGEAFTDIALGTLYEDIVGGG